MDKKSILTIKETVERSHEEGMPITEYTLRRALKSGAIKCRIVGKKYLIAWENVERWFMCVDGQDNHPVPQAEPVTVSTEKYPGNNEYYIGVRRLTKKPKANVKTIRPILEG